MNATEWNQRRYAVERRAGIEAAEAFAKSAGLATLPLDVLARFLPINPEWATYCQRRKLRRMIDIRVVAPSPSADATGELGLAVADRSQEAAEAAGGDPPVPPGSGGPVSGSRPASWPGRGEPTGPDAEDPPHITISPAACGCDPDCMCLGCPVCEARRPEFKEPDGMRDDLREGEK